MFGGIGPSKLLSIVLIRVIPKRRHDSNEDFSDLRPPTPCCKITHKVKKFECKIEPSRGKGNAVLDTKTT